METDREVYYLNSLNEKGRLADLIKDEDIIPIEVEESLKRLQKDFNKENLMNYFYALDNWEEMLQDDYIGDVYEVIKEEPDHIIVEFYQADNPTRKDICTYFLV